ncbi:ferrochelatase [Cellulomonas sp. APG4]|uniref:ferrochelatase n=1 Tax=Cellulomonas sp. APG4 TaxID=1538656 RepID=UPI001379AF1D|nr:ferrochelatase [Cellulomonas sp. APG4]
MSAPTLPTGGAAVNPESLPHAEPEAPSAYDAVLLVSFGGPEGQDDVLPFLRNVTRGRGIPDERLEEVAHHYRAFGGVSPINDQNRALRAALQAEIDQRGLELPVLWGNRNWDPYLTDALREAHAAGHRRLLAVVTSAYSSYSGCRQYREDLARALEETGLAGEMHIDKVRQYFDHPGFVAPFVDGVQGALERAEQGGVDLASTHVLFVTHSIPTQAALASGPPEAELGPEGAYGAQHRAVAEVVMTAVGRDVPWSLVYQSRSGAPSTPWLEPDVNDAITELAGQGTKAVVIVPLGFVSDHMEVLWDLDEEALTTAREADLWAERVPTPGVDPAFVRGLVDLVTERVEGQDGGVRPALTALGPWYDVCRPGCCAGREVRPAVAGLAP